MNKYTFPLFCCLAIPSFGQHNIKGVIVDNNQTPISFADVVILTDKKVIDQVSTDENGVFNTLLEDGIYTILIENNSVTLHQFTTTISEGKDLGIILIPNQEQFTLGETVIIAQKKLIEKKVDRLIFNTDQAEGAKGGNAIDALKLAPRIKVDETTDAISIIGKGNVMVLINDRLSQMDANQLTNYLKTIRAEDIEKIEVITNPPAKYDASGNSGVINIVLKTGKSNSFNGNVSGSGNYAKYKGGNINGGINFRKEKWTISSRAFQGENTWGNDSFSFISYPTNQWETANRNKNINGFGGIGITTDYQVNDKLITGITIDYSSGKGDTYNTSRTDIYDLPSYLLNRYITNDAKGSYWEWKYFGLNYHVIKKFDDEGKKLTFDFDYSKNSSGSGNTMVSNEFLADTTPLPDKLQGNKTIDDGNADRLNFSADMEHPIGNWKMNYGTRLRVGKDENSSNRFSKTSGDYIEQEDYRYNFSYHEDIYALYYSVEKQLNEKWSTKVGLRYEHANVKGYSKEQNISYHNKYDGIFPTAYLMYQAAENHSFSLNYSRRVDRPFMWYLNPMVIKNNDYSYTTGNPNLVPSYSNNVEFEYAFKDLSVTSIYFSKSDDLMGQISQFDPETQIQLAKPFNYAKSISVGISENINIKPIKIWRINASFNGYYIKTTGNIPGYDYAIDGITGSLRITNNIELNKKKTLFANYTYSYFSTGSDSDLDEFTDFMSHNGGIRALFFNKKLQVAFNVNNIFKDKLPIYSRYFNGIYSSNYQDPLRSFRLGLTYSFGKQFNIEKSKSNQEQTGSGQG